MLFNDKLKADAFISPSSRSFFDNDKNRLFDEEKKAIKEVFASYGQNVDWGSDKVKKELNAFAKKVIETTVDTVGMEDVVPMLLPQKTVGPDDTYIEDELYGTAVYQGRYGGAVRMSRPMVDRYEATTSLKETGIELELNKIQVGKYSPSELGEYTAGLINAWKQRLLFVNTLAQMTVYDTGGGQVVANGLSVGIGTILAAAYKLTDEADIKVIVGRRNAVARLSTSSEWSDATKREFETGMIIGKAAGIPVMKINSFTDNLYGTVYPMPDKELWMFSVLPAGAYVQAGPLRTWNEVIGQREVLNLYYRWDDGIGIFRTKRIARITGIS